MAQFLNRSEIVAKVRADMARRRITQKDMARKLGVSEGYFSDFIRENRGVGPQILLALGYSLEPHYRREKRNGSAEE